MRLSIRVALPFRLATAMVFLVIGPAVAFLDTATSPALAQSTAPAPFVFSGYTRTRGGDTTLMLGRVQVDLYCSTNPDDLGERIATVRSDSIGVYELATSRSCEFYNLVAVPPQGQVAYWVLTIDGKAMNDSWIQYTQPLQGKELGRNEFWMIADFMVAVTPTPFPARTSRPTATQTLTASPSATASTQATANPGPPVLEYIVGVVVASGVILVVRRALQPRPNKD
jgi:hypothetical protein